MIHVIIFVPVTDRHSVFVSWNEQALNNSLDFTEETSRFALQYPFIQPYVLSQYFRKLVHKTLYHKGHRIRLLVACSILWVTHFVPSPAYLPGLINLIMLGIENCCTVRPYSFSHRGNLQSLMAKTANTGTQKPIGSLLKIAYIYIYNIRTQGTSASRVDGRWFQPAYIVNKPQFD